MFRTFWKFPHPFVFFIQTSGNLTHAIVISLPNKRKYSIFAIFFGNFFQIFENFPASGGLRLPPRTLYLEPPEFFSCVLHWIEHICYTDVGWKNYVTAFCWVWMNGHVALSKMHLRNFAIQRQYSPDLHKIDFLAFLICRKLRLELLIKFRCPVKFECERLKVKKEN